MYVSPRALDCRRCAAAQTYDRAGRLLEVAHVTSSATLSRFTYGLDAAGRPATCGISPSALAVRPQGRFSTGSKMRDRDYRECFQTSPPAMADRPSKVDRVAALVVVSVASLAPTWFLYLRSPARRSVRSVILLLAISMLWMAGVSLWPSVLGWALVITSATVAIAGLFGFHELLGRMPASDHKADEVLWTIQREVLNHRRPLHLDRDDDRQRHVVRLKAEIARVRAVVVPEPWELLRRQLLDALEGDRQALEAGRALDADAAAESARRWHALDADRAALRTRRASFWR